jgi:hypothetical protein
LTAWHARSHPPYANLLLLGIVRLRDVRALPAVERRGLYAASPALPCTSTDGMRLRRGAVEGTHEDTHDSAMTPPRRSVRPADQATSEKGGRQSEVERKGEEGVGGGTNRRQVTEGGRRKIQN